MSEKMDEGAQLLPAPGKLPELKRKFNETNNALSEVRLQAAEYGRQALEEARLRIARDLEERFGYKEQALKADLAEIEQALEDEKDALARAGIPSAPLFANSPPHPAVGTVMIEDEEAISRLKRPPRKAVVEIVNRDTFSQSSNKLRAGLGDVVLRVLRKDGAPTDEYAPMDRYRWKLDQAG